jgi:hypothetical protein
VESSNFNRTTVPCPAGKVVISGGNTLSSITAGSVNDFTPTVNNPTTTTEWTAAAFFTGGGLWTYTVYALCAAS